MKDMIELKLQIFEFPSDHIILLFKFRFSRIFACGLEFLQETLLQCYISSVQFSVFIVLHHLHHVTTDTLQNIRTIIIPNKRTLHNDKKRKMCAVTKVA